MEKPKGNLNENLAPNVSWLNSISLEAAATAAPSDHNLGLRVCLCLEEYKIQKERTSCSCGVIIFMKLKSTHRPPMETKSICLGLIDFGKFHWKQNKTKQKGKHNKTEIK